MEKLTKRYAAAIALVTAAVLSATSTRHSQAQGAMPVLAVAVCAQVLIGIVTLVAAAPIALAMLHQAIALVVLTAATLHASRATIMPASSPARRLASGY